MPLSYFPTAAGNPWHSFFTYVSLQSLPPFSPGLPLRVSSLLLSLIGAPVIGFRACPKPRIISSWNFQLYLPKTYSQIRMHAQVIGFGDIFLGNSVQPTILSRNQKQHFHGNIAITTVRICTPRFYPKMLPLRQKEKGLKEPMPPNF